MSSAIAESVKALVFDVFGTVVDWRGSIIRELESFGREAISRPWRRCAAAPCPGRASTICIG
jgi:2-haloacid dehalogenase